jgi:ectoine hydroxylase-related dioxygenase (phytanoyl-CoA dioxygenase family)
VSFDSAGYEVIENVLSAVEAQRLLAALGKLKVAPRRGGVRRIERLVPEVAALAQSRQLLRIAEKYLPDPSGLVRAIYFDKSPDNNWFVTWHQDRTVAVSVRFESAEWGPWSRKAGAWHTQPPIDVLERMVTIRIHLDAATKANGCLKIIPGSHRLGLVASDRVLEYVDKDHVVYCETPVGGAVVMRPHIMHASEKSRTNAPRRVLHFEYSSFRLPEGVAWGA